jgi:hypothetical protein
LPQALANPRTLMYGVRLIQGGTMAGRDQAVNRSPMHLLHQAEQAARMLFSANAIDFITPRQLAILSRSPKTRA